MKRLVTSLVVGLFFVGAGIPSAHAASLFPRDLHVGDSGPDVLALQQVLNESSSTQIAANGPGSPGHETNYFGALTKSAVIRYQDKYATIILAPIGLTKGTGYVGFSTRAMLIAQKPKASEAFITPAPVKATSIVPKTTPTIQATTSTIVAHATTPAPTTHLPIPAVTSSTSTTSTNPNEAHLSALLTAIKKLGAKQGMSATHIQKVVDAIRKEAATTTNMTQKFLSKLPRTNSMNMSLGNSTLGHEVLALATHALTTLGLVTPAKAVSGVPFGGAIFSAISCTCSYDVYLVFLDDMGPAGADLLSYAGGSQAFAYYTLPDATWVLGNYEPAVPACWFYAGTACFDSPAYGLISPVVGSSAY